jgi:hypothetical protein
MSYQDKQCVLDDTDGKTIREYDKKNHNCPHCIIDLVYLGHGDYDEIYECYCQTVYEPFAPHPGELL